VRDKICEAESVIEEVPESLILSVVSVNPQNLHPGVHRKEQFYFTEERVTTTTRFRFLQWVDVEMSLQCNNIGYNG